MTTKAVAATVPAQRSPARTRPAAAKPPLKLVLPAPSRAPRMPFALCVAGLLCLLLVGLLLLNTMLAQGSFAVHELQRRTAALSDEQQQLQTKVSLAGSPHVLAQKARALGLVQVRDPAFIRTSDGKVLGQPRRAERPAVPAPAVKPAAAAQPAAAAKPGAAPKPTAATKPTPGAKPSPAAAGAKPQPRRSP